ncbi:Arm DNA-binding domain-containing protein [Metasolibacillus sp. FSL H7-0170]|uniref:Arm DNA-binding domain-containing protein n=1 Tax=Metasolibacillus sp. FSL H7-0170 TaxID=2921431 RepID=UPI00315896DA
MAKSKTGSIESYTLKNGEKRYRFQIYIGLDPLTGKELRTTRSKFKTKKEAELVLARLKLEIANGQYKNILTLVVQTKAMVCATIFL